MAAIDLTACATLTHTDRVSCHPGAGITLYCFSAECLLLTQSLLL